MTVVTHNGDRAKRRFDLLARLVVVAANSRNEEKKTEDRVTVEREIERLARELARIVNEAPADDRDELRTYALGLVREEVRESEPVAEGDRAASSSSGSNPLAMGIPVLLVGGFLVFLFPPVGLLLIVVAVFLVIWGLLAVLVGGRSRRRG